MVRADGCLEVERAVSQLLPHVVAVPLTGPDDRVVRLVGVSGWHDDARCTHQTGPRAMRPFMLGAFAAHKAEGHGRSMGCEISRSLGGTRAEEDRRGKSHERRGESAPVAHTSAQLIKAEPRCGASCRANRTAA